MMAEGESSLRSACAVVSAMVLLFDCSAGGAEKIQDKKPAEINAPEKVEDSRSRDFDPVTRKGTGGSMTDPIYVAPPLPSLKLRMKLQEKYDEEKNWIFRDPQQANRTSLGGDLFVLPKNQQSKNAMERFLERKKSSSGTKNDSLEEEKDETTRSTSPFSVESRFNSGRFSDFNLSGAINPIQSPNAINELLSKAKLQPRPAEFLSPSLGNGPPRPSPAFEQRNQVESLIGSPALNSPRLGPLDPINIQADTTRLDINPITPGPGLAGGRNPILETARPQFGLGAAGLAQPPNPLDNLNFSPRALGESSLAPSVAAPRSQLIQPRPAVLEMPRRPY